MTKLIGYVPLCLALSITAAYFLLGNEPSGNPTAPNIAEPTVVTRRLVEPPTAPPTPVMDALVTPRSSLPPVLADPHPIAPVVLPSDEHREGAEWDLPEFEGSVDFAGPEGCHPVEEITQDLFPWWEEDLQSQPDYRLLGCFLGTVREVPFELQVLAGVFPDGRLTNASGLLVQDEAVVGRSYLSLGTPSLLGFTKTSACFADLSRGRFYAVDLLSGEEQEYPEARQVCTPEGWDLLPPTYIHGFRDGSVPYPFQLSIDPRFHQTESE